MNRANPTVRVGFFWKTSKGCYYLKWKDPGEHKKYLTRKTSITARGVRAERQAGKLAEALQDELNEKLRRPDSDPTWEVFADEYKRNHLDATSPANVYKWNAVKKIFEDVAKREIVGVVRMSDVTPRLVVAVETEVRKRVSAGSVSSYMATLRSGLNWAASLEMMRYLPPIRARGRQCHELPAMRLVPITEESLELMFSVVKKVVGKAHAESATDYLRALWLSGCRMQEPLGIHANRQDCHRPLELGGRNPRMCWVTSQKNRRDQIAPITMDFAADIRRRVHRGGYLYQLTCETGVITDRTAISKMISAIGKEAGVIAEPGASAKFATAKHFRSSFVTRWSLLGMPLERIQKIVRHQDIATTRKYYLGNTEGVSDFDEARCLLKVTA